MSENLPSGDSVTLIEQLLAYATTLNLTSPDSPNVGKALDESAKALRAAADRLAVLELRESERSKGWDASKVGGVEVEELFSRLDRWIPAGQLADRAKLRQVFDLAAKADGYRVEADCCLRDFDRLEVTAGILEDGLQEIAQGRRNKPFDPWAREVASRTLTSALANPDSATANSVGLPDPDPVESDRQSSGNRGSEASTARRVEAGKRIEYAVLIYGSGGGVMREFREFGEPGETPQETADRIFNEVADDSNVGTVGIWAEDRKSGHAQTHRTNSATAALPPPESGSLGLGSASALEVEDVHLDELPSPDGDSYWPPVLRYCECSHRETDHLAPNTGCAMLGCDCKKFVAAATKPEASPSPENESAELGDEQSSSCGGAS